MPYLIGFLPKDLCGSGSLSEEVAESVFLQTSVSDAAGRFRGLFPRVNEDEDLVLACVIHHLIKGGLVDE